MRASGLLPLQELKGTVVCVPESEVRDLSMRGSFVQKLKIRSQRRKNGNEVGTGAIHS